MMVVVRFVSTKFRIKTIFTMMITIVISVIIILMCWHQRHHLSSTACGSEQVCSQLCTEGPANFLKKSQQDYKPDDPQIASNFAAWLTFLGNPLLCVAVLYPIAVEKIPALLTTVSKATRSTCQPEHQIFDLRHVASP